MASDSVIDIERLLTPFDGDLPCGVDIRNDPSPVSLYYKMKDARSTARSAERLADVEGHAEVPTEWRAILSLGTQALAEQGKDLEVAAWIVEALVRLEGFAGLRDGLILARRLVEDFWDGLYPLEDEDGLETKVAPLTGLNGEGGPGTLIQPIRKVAITNGYDPGPFATWQVEAVLELEKIADEDKRQEKIDQGAATRAQVQASVAASGRAFFVTLVDDLGACVTELRALGDALDQRCGNHSPPTGNIRDLLENVLSLVRYLAADLLVDPAATEAAVMPVAVGGAPAAVQAAGAAPVAVGGIQTREQAFAALNTIATFFRQSEPQSLLPQMLENVIRRGRMSAAELLAELVPDRDTRETLYVRAGVRPPEE